MNILRSRVALFGLLATSISLAQPASAEARAPSPPSVTVTPSADTAAVNDTITVDAVLRMLGGKLAPSTSPVAWTVTAGDVAVFRIDSAAHRVRVIVRDTGAARVVASWRTASGRVIGVNGQPVMELVTVRDSISVTVGAPRIDSMVVFNVVSNGRTSFVPKDPGGWCLYRVDWHRSRAITGRPSNWTTNDPLFLNAVTGARAGCSDADTTVDPQKVEKAKTSP